MTPLSRRTVLAASLALAPAAAIALPDPKAPSIKRRYIDGAYGQIHVREAAAKGAETGPPLVLMHQSPLSGRMFDKFMPYLAVCRRVIAADTPGYGESDRPAARPTAAAYANAIVDAVTATYGAPVDLLGYHTGAGLAPFAAAQHTDKVRRLVLISVPYFEGDARTNLLANVEKDEKYASSEEAYQADGSHLPPLWTGTYRVKPEGQSLDDVARIVAEKQRGGRYSGWALTSLLDADLTPVLGAVTQPTLVIAPHDGLQDESKAAADLIANSDYVELPNLAYGLFDAAPAAVAEPVLAFLNGA